MTMNYLKQSWAELKQIWPKIMFSNNSLSTEYWTFMFRFGPDWIKSSIPVAWQGRTPKFEHVWEFRFGIVRVKMQRDIKFDKVLLDQRENLRGAFIYVNFKFL